MAKFHGIIGYIETVETEPGVYMEQKTERTYDGNTERNMSNWSSSSESTNDDLNINNQISVIADPYAYQHFHYIKYVEFMGARWKVKSAEVKYPRLLLTLGGVYNG